MGAHAQESEVPGPWSGSWGGATDLGRPGRVEAARSQSDLRASATFEAPSRVGLRMMSPRVFIKMPMAAASLEGMPIALTPPLRSAA